jgi:hypothetical protein
LIRHLASLYSTCRCLRHDGSNRRSNAALTATRTRSQRQIGDRDADQNKIAPCLWFDHQGEEAARFYTSIFPNSRILGITLSDPDPEKSGRAMDAMLKKKKIDIAGLERAYAGK